MYIEDKDLRAIERLWRELSEFSPGAFEQAQEHCFRALARLIGAANVFWVAGSLAQQTKTEQRAKAGERMKGWRVRAARYLHHEERQDRLFAAVVRHVGSGLPDPHVEAMVATAGDTRAFLRQEIVDDRTFLDG